MGASPRRDGAGDRRGTGAGRPGADPVVALAVAAGPKSGTGEAVLGSTAPAP